MISKLKMMSSVVAFMFLLTAAVFGQETTGNIEVTVTDPSSARVPGASVRVTQGSAFDRTVTTDEEGFVRVLQLQPGFYSVIVNASGFGAKTFENVEVVLGKTTPVNGQLTAGGVAETVEVSAADVAPIDPTDNKIQTNITARAAELLPKGTNFTSILKVAPAVRSEGAAGGFQIDGASGSENTFIIDGQEVTNFRTGTLNTANNIPFQFVQEVQVKSSGFEAEFGGATGGVINVVTKSGTNDWRGEFGIQFEPSELQAGPRRFLNLFPATTASPLGVARYVQPARDKGNNFFPTANLSGPIIKDRAWFFASYTPQYFHTIRQVTFTNPNTLLPVVAPAGANNPDEFRQNQTRHYLFTRVDANIFDTLRFTGSYTYNPVDLEGLLPAFGAELTTAIPSLTFPSGEIRRGSNFLGQQGGRQNSQNVSGQFTWTPTANLVVNARGGYSFLNEKLTSYGVPNPTGITRFSCSTASVGTIPSEANCAPGTQNFPAFESLLFDVSRRRTLDLDASYILSNLGGRHQFKGGFQYNGIANNVISRTVDQISLQYGRTINQVSTIPASILPPTPGAIGAGLFRRFFRGGEASSNNQSVFIQDNWQPMSRLSLNFGIRFEKEEAPSFIPGNPSITFGWGDKPAPRLGFAFDLTGDGKTKLFASYGWFYDRFKYELPRGSFGGEFFRDDYFEIFPGMGAFNGTSFTGARVIGSNPDPPGGRCPITGSTGISRCQRDFRIPSNVGLGLEFGAIDPDIKPFRQSEFTVGLERDLSGGYLFSSRYTHKQVDEAIEDIGFLNAQGSEAYVIGNPGKGLAREVSEDFGFTPLEAVREYDAFEVRVDKRFTRRYYFNVNYTWSRLFGNYSGLASSDEAGRTSPNVNRFFDLPFIGFSGLGQPDNGRLPTDRPHVLKGAAGYTLDWQENFGFGGKNSTEFTVFSEIRSGTPVTSRFTFYGVNNTILGERGDLGRTSAFTNTDFGLRHRYRFGSNERFTMVFDLDILNVFNESNELRRSENINTGANVGGENIGLSDDEATAIAAFQTRPTRDAILAYINRPTASGGGGGTAPTFNQPIEFQAGRSVRFGFRLLF